MVIDKNLALKLWRDVYGDKLFVQDCFGYWMYRDAYSNVPVVIKDHLGGPNNYDYSWNIDHIRPKSSFRNESDADDFNNFELMHRVNNLEKSDNYPVFTSNDHIYRVVPNNYGGYGIADASGRRIGWKKDGRHY